MITIFAVPKAFDSEFGILQMNAIRSWREECPNSEILLMSKEPGVKEAAHKFQAKYIPDIQTNQWGTPYVNVLFDKAAEIAKYDVLALINADCILIGDLESAVKTVQEQFTKFLMIATRYDSKIKEPLPSSDWQSFVLANKGLLHPLARRKMGKTSIGGMDIWVFPKGTYPKIPPLAIGRLNWDSWLVSDPYERHITIFDITKQISLIHQEHSLNLKEGAAKDEVEFNRNLVVGMNKKFVRDADFILENGQFKREQRISLFTCPKPFTGKFKITQRNAIQSWQAACPNSEIILTGKNPKFDELSQEFPQIFPVQAKLWLSRDDKIWMKSVFRRGISAALYGVQGYIDSETILLGDLEKIVLEAKQKFRRFLLIGRRWRLPKLETFIFSDNWAFELATKLKTEGKLCASNQIAYLIFSSDTFFWRDFPIFRLEGRLWEGWLINEAIKRKARIVDITPVFTAIHPDTKIGVENFKNCELAQRSIPKTIDDAQYIFTFEGIRERSK